MALIIKELGVKRSHSGPPQVWGACKVKRSRLLHVILAMHGKIGMSNNAEVAKNYVELATGRESTVDYL